MKKNWIPAALVIALASMIAAGIFVSRAVARDDDHHDRDSDRFDSDHFEFKPDTIVLSRSVYVGDASTVTAGEILPPGCVAGNVSVPLIAGGTVSVAVTCGVASDNGEFPNLSDSHNVWNNANTDGSFGITSPIFLDNLTPDGERLDTLRIPNDQIVTSFSSKSELA